MDDQENEGGGQTGAAVPPTSRANPAEVEPGPLRPGQSPLAPLERPIAVKGHNGTVTFDGWWIEIQRTGGLARVAAKINAFESKCFPISRVEQVVWKRPSMLVNGYLEFVVGGEQRFHGKITAGGANPYAVLATKQMAKDFEPLYAALLKALADSRTTGTTPVRHTSHESAKAVSVSVAALASWYPDPANPGFLRWWDGRAWTEHITATPSYRPGPETVRGTERAGTGRRVEHAPRRHLTMFAWAGLALGTLFASAAAVDAEIGIFLLFGVLAGWCGWWLIRRDRDQDQAQQESSGVPAGRHGRQPLPNRPRKVR
ncbi:DUF2510 domain-containing protein [Nocardia sp. FBN12]|uniref:DUF2510 domain-containing protein n=1 Tax=Nocardia sp. FBN12 TaxID=3419766 RepID=UPI003D05883F